MELKVDDLGAEGKIEVRAKKTGKPAQANVPPDLEKRLRTSAGQFWLFPSPRKGGIAPMTRQAAHKAIKKAAVKTGLDRIGPHSSRKTFAKAMQEQGKSLGEIQAALHHTRPETTLMYLIEQGWTVDLGPKMSDVHDGIA